MQSLHRNTILCLRCLTVVPAIGGVEVNWCRCTRVAFRVGVDGIETAVMRRVHYGQPDYAEVGLGPRPIKLKRYRGAKVRSAPKY